MTKMLFLGARFHFPFVPVVVNFCNQFPNPASRKTSTLLDRERSTVNPSSTSNKALKKLLVSWGCLDELIMALGTKRLLNMAFNNNDNHLYVQFEEGYMAPMPIRNVPTRWALGAPKRRIRFITVSSLQEAISLSWTSAQSTTWGPKKLEQDGCPWSDVHFWHVANIYPWV